MLHITEHLVAFLENATIVHLFEFFCESVFVCVCVCVCVLVQELKTDLCPAA